ncbi:MAG TPA: hypothetical protein VIF15_02100 [Polyangiaceae bacterium]|jgi:hypothetical protein
MAEPSRFHPLFERWARSVRSRLLARRVLTGLAVGLALAVIPALVAWKTRHGALRPLCAVGGLVGAVAGVVIARRKRWSDVDVALWLDDRLDTEEAITTAVELRNQAEDDEEARAVVVSTAATALAGADGKRARPTILRPLHALAPLAVAALVFVARSPLPVAPVVAQAPGEAMVQITQVEGLKRVAQLGQASARDDAQRDRLEKIAKDADKLKADLEKGLEKREALDRIAKLRDQIAAERLTLGEGEKRAGLEAAVSKLEQNDATKEAAKALGDHDLEKMDKEMERLANAREKRDRESAKKALEDAAAAAKANGAPDVGKALEQEKKAMEEREKRAEALRDLEKAMEGSGLASPEQKSEAESLDRTGTDEAAKKLADSMGKALEKLTPEERKKLAEKLKEQASKGGTQSSPQDLKDLADDLSTPEGQKKLEDELKDMANQDDESPESKQQKDLDDAEQGADGTEGEINGQKPGEGQQPGQGQSPGQGQGQGLGQQPGENGGPGNGHGGKTPIPLPGEGPGQGQGQGNDGPGGPGSHHDTGTGPHNGQTGEVGAGTMRSRSHGRMNRAPGMPGTTTGWNPGKSGGTANVQGTGALGTAGPSEIDGVDHSEVPEEYREQVRQYFQP